MINREWWQHARTDYEIYISEAVLEEIGAGDPDASARRQAFVTGLPILALTDEVSELAREYQGGLGLPTGAQLDAVHLAYASAYEVDYLLTWNCKHLANGVVIKRLIGLNDAQGRRTPVIVTPEEMLEVPDSAGME